MFARTRQRASVAPAREPAVPLGAGSRGDRPGSGRGCVASRRRTLAAWTGALALAAVSAIQVVPATAAVPIDPRPSPAEPPTDRVLEQVSPIDKGGQPVDHVLQIADGEGGGVVFQSLGAFGDVQNNNADTFYRARRGATGWEITGMQPRPIETIPSSLTTPQFVKADTELESLIATTAYPFFPEVVRPGTGSTLRNVYRFGAQGAVSWLSGEARAANGVLGYAEVGAVSADGQRVLIVGLATGSPSRLYVRDGDRTVDISVGPDGAPLPGAAPASTGADPSPMRSAQAMSEDGQTVAFHPTDASGRAQGALYVRRDALRPNASTVVVNRSRRAGDPAGTVCGTSRFFGMTPDGRRMLLACTTPLTDDAPATGQGVYAYDVATDALEFLGTTTPGTLTAVAIDLPRQRIYYTTAVNRLQDLYVFEDGEPRELATNVGGLTAGVGGMASPDGEQLAFLSDRGIDGYSGRQMYLYDARKGSEGTITCISCVPGASSGGTASFGPRDVNSPGGATNARVSNFTADGRFYFMSTAALTPEAAEGPANVYEYHEGEVRLVVAGAPGAPGMPANDARFAGVSADGTDLFVITRRSLLPQDDDAPVPDLYTLRRGGGFPPPPECVDCEPPAPEDRGGPRPGAPIGSQQDVPPTHGARPAPATPRPRIVSRTARGTTARVRVRVNDSGTLRVTGNGLRRLNRKVSRAGTYTLTVRLSAHGRRTLDRRGRIKVRPRVRFAPEQGAATSTRTTLTIKRTRKAS